MFNFFKRKSEVLNHWIAFADGFQTSPAEFYTALEKELAERKIPSMEMSRIEFPEGGLLSEKRVYLRLLRERLVFDVCAAPFGSGFFFSCRTAEIPIAVKWWHWLLLYTVGNWVVAVVFILVHKATGSLSFAFTMLVIFCAFVISTLRNAVAMGLQDLDATLIKLPVIGPLYEKLFRKETYHRIDSRLCYLEVVPTLVKQLAGDTTAAQGVKLVRQYEAAPILGELYRPVIPRTPQAPEPPRA